MVFLSTSERSLDASFPVPLEAIASEDGDLDFPRLVDLPYKAEDDSKFLIKLLSSPQGDTFFEVYGSDTVDQVKKQAIRSAKSRGVPLMLNRKL